MKSIGELITDANADDGRTDVPVPAEPRPHRVTLCVMTFAQVEVIACSPVAAMRAAEAIPAEAKRTFRTAPGAHRVEIQRRTNPRDPNSPLEWIEVPS